MALSHKKNGLPHDGGSVIGQNSLVLAYFEFNLQYNQKIINNIN